MRLFGNKGLGARTGFCGRQTKGTARKFWVFESKFSIILSNVKIFPYIYIIVRKFVCLGYKKVCMVYEFSVIVEIFN